MLSVVSDSEMLVMFVTLDGEGTAKNIRESIKNLKTDSWNRKEKGIEKLGLSNI